jgi:hypothetical protein
MEELAHACHLLHMIYDPHKTRLKITNKMSANGKRDHQTLTPHLWHAYGQEEAKFGH